VILDEADLLLSAQNMEPLISLLQIYLDWTAQLVLLCTTMSKEVQEFVGETMADPIKIIVNTKEELAHLEGTFRVECSS